METDKNLIVELTVTEDILTIEKKPKPSTLDLTLNELIDSIPEDFQYPDDVADFVQSEAAGQALL